MYIDDIYISLKLDAGVQSLTFLKKKRGCSRKEVSKVFLLRTRSERSSRRGGELWACRGGQLDGGRSCLMLVVGDWQSAAE